MATRLSIICTLRDCPQTLFLMCHSQLLFSASKVTFGEGRLGFTLFREDAGPRKGKGVVCKVHPGSTAHSLGVREGDTVSGVNKHR